MEQIVTKREQTQDDRCRVCLESTESAIELLNITIGNEKLSFWDILHLFCTIEKENNLNAPQKICVTCADKAEACYEFKLVCEHSDRILQTELNLNSRNDVKVEVTEEKSKTEFIDVNTIHNSPDFQLKSESEDSNGSIDDLKQNQYNVLIKEKPLEKLSNDYTCKNCGTVIQKRNIAKHMRTKKCKERDFPVICACNYKPTSLIDFTDHQKLNRCGGLERNACTYCDYTYIFRTTYHKHLVEFHSDKKKGCGFCKKVYFQERSLESHMKVQHQNENVIPDKCKMCGFVPNLQVSLVKHMKEEHVGEDLKKCDYCEYTDVCPFKVGKHMTQSHEDKKIVQCPKCEKRFFKRRLMLAHLKCQHEKSEPIVCEICGKTFKMRSNLKHHMHIHNGIKKYECKECGKRFCQNSTLTHHLFSHSEDRNYKCEECGAIYKTSKSLKKHVLAIHEHVRRYECNICTKKFFDSGGYKVHMKAHAGIKNHKCEVCGKAFGRKTLLVQHTVVHTGERRHVCEICGKRFTQAHVLRTHLNIHKKADSC